MSDDPKKFDEAVEVGSEAFGGAVGAAIGLGLGGPAGAIAGAATGSVASAVLRKVGIEITNRLLARGEQRRIGTAVILAANLIKERQARGERIRDDGFLIKVFIIGVQQKKLQKELCRRASESMRRRRYDIRLSC